MGIGRWPGVGDDATPHRVALETVPEVDDVVAKRDWALGAGGALAGDLVTWPWGLTDFRSHGQDGNCQRATGR